MSEMIQNQSTGANAQTTIQKQAMQKWLAVQVEKFHQAGYQITAKKLGCNPVREELEEHNICHAILETEEKICDDTKCNIEIDEESLHHHH